MLSNLLRKLVLLGSFGVLLGGAATARAGNILDDAGLFSPRALQKANAEIAAIEKESHREFDIETLATVPNGKADEVAKMSVRERDKFFDEWARERAVSRKTKGVYVLITKTPGHVQIEVDRPTRNAGFGAAQKVTLRDNFLAGFKKKDYDRGLLDAVEYARSALHSRTGNVGRTGAPTAVPHRPADPRGVGGAPAVGGGMGLFGWAIVIGAVFLGIRLLSGLFRGMSGGGAPGGYGGGGGGGGMFSSLLTGMFGAMAGHWLYDSFFSGHHGSGSAFGGDSYDQGAGNVNDGAGQDFEGSGGDFGDSGSGGGDFGGGDSGGGDFGGGDFGGGGDF